MIPLDTLGGIRGGGIEELIRAVRDLDVDEVRRRVGAESAATPDRRSTQWQRPYESIM